MVDLKITELDALTTVLGEDLLAIVDDPTGTASTKKIRTDDFQRTWHVGCRVYHNADQSIDNSSATKLAFNSEVFDTDTMHDNSTNNSRITINTAGKYLFIFHGSWSAAATLDGQFTFLLNNTTTLGWERQAGQIASTIAAIVDCAVTNYMEVSVSQTSGGALNMRYLAEYSAYFYAQRVG